jgi:hypothetical protein
METPTALTLDDLNSAVAAAKRLALEAYAAKSTAAGDEALAEMQRLCRERWQLLKGGRA